MMSTKQRLLIEGSAGVIALAVLVVALMMNWSAPSSLPTSSPAHTSIKSTTQEPSSPTGLTSVAQPLPSGDIPDNAIFVSYTSSNGGYSLQYIEGWVVTEQPKGGITIKDKDSSVNVRLVSLPPEGISTYVQQTDLPHLRHMVESFARKSLNSVVVNEKTTMKLSFTGLSVSDPVTGKKRSVISDRYYLAGPHKLAILTLTTPTGVDNVDAFNQILHSFSWK